MNKKGFTLVELLAVIVLLGLILVITMTNGFGIFNKAKGGINKIEEDNLIEAAKVFLVDVENDFVTNWPSNGFNKDNISVVCDGSNCYYVTIDSNNKITKNICTDAFCGTTIDVGYLKNNMYFNDNKESCKADKKLNIRLEGNLEYTNYIVKNQGTEDICKKTGSPSIDYKLFNAAKEYLKNLVKNNDSSISNYFNEKVMTFSEFKTASGFIEDTGYTCNGNITLQILGTFNVVDYIVEKQSDEAICTN